MDTHQLTAIHQALLCVTDTVGMLTFPRCDQDDVFELIDRLEVQLTAEHPDTQVIATSFELLARSLSNQPEAHEACLRIAEVITKADGLVGVRSCNPVTPPAACVIARPDPNDPDPGI